jgi:hypothetical protein
MSIAEERSAPDMKIGPSGSIVAAKKIVTAYFEDPLHYIFYLSLTALVVGLFLGMDLSWQFYTTIYILAVFKIVLFLIKLRKQELIQ